MKIVNLNDTPRTYSFKPKPRPTYCDHSVIEIDEETRSVKCEKCNCVLDPFDWIFKQFLLEEQAFAKYKNLLKNIGNLEKEIWRLRKLKDSM